MSQKLDPVLARQIQTLVDKRLDKRFKVGRRVKTSVQIRRLHAIMVRASSDEEFRTRAMRNFPRAAKEEGYDLTPLELALGKQFAAQQANAMTQDLIDILKNGPTHMP